LVAAFLVVGFLALTLLAAPFVWVAVMIVSS